jgi:ferrochelatase
MSRYPKQFEFAHGIAACTGVLITNLGTPDAPTTKAVRVFLGEFLSDPRVVEMSHLLWWLILHGVILRVRPRRSARAYRNIWTAEGSPLSSITKRQVVALQETLARRIKGPVRVVLGMRYGKPSIAEGLLTLQRMNARRLLILPLYPQYSATTTASTFDAVANVLMRWRWLPALQMITHYHDEPPYIQALADSIERQWVTHGRSERLLFSFHGIPKRYFLAGDPYHCQCHKTARLVSERLGLEEAHWWVAFQSRFGRAEWLKPYTDHVLREWAGNGVQSVDVVCPGFSVDCLETLEEIALQNRDVFLGAGGQSFHYIPALNDSPAHIEALAEVVAKHIQGWPEADADWDPERSAREASQAAERARVQGAAR